VRVGRRGAAEYQPLIRELPAQERPRERLRKYGAASLSNAELLAIVLRTGAASESVLNLSAKLLARFGGLDGLVKAGFGELCSERGLGAAKASQLKAALELGRRVLGSQAQDRFVVRCPDDIASLLSAEMALLEQEELRLVLLDSKNQVQSVANLYKGSVNTSLVRISEMFREAVREGCPALIAVHNHPSGDPTPSQEDIRITEQLVEAGKLLDIEVLDHIIIGHQRYVSLKEQELGFPKG
jgi:DNA repair protein RadC